MCNEGYYLTAHGYEPYEYPEETLARLKKEKAEKRKEKRDLLRIDKERERLLSAK